jgi:hypothetical protein
VRGRIAALGLPDPLDSQRALAELADDETSQLRAVLAAWQGQYGERPRTVRQVLDDGAIPGPLRDALADWLDLEPGERPGARSLGRRLRGIRDRVCGGRVLRACGDKGEDGTRWVVKPAR